MTNVNYCGYINCYFNNNIEKTCTKDSLTVSATGECETVMHCDEFVCRECDMFEFCEKDKKTG